jgi:NAD(P)-dependent dehydrogenase (short-subunit alcohol dehydrogenase family)
VVVEGDGGRGDRREPGHWGRARCAPRRARTHRGAHRAGRPPLREHGLAVLFRRLDVSDPASVAELAAWLRDAVGGLDILVQYSIFH